MAFAELLLLFASAQGFFLESVYPIQHRLKFGFGGQAQGALFWRMVHHLAQLVDALSPDKTIGTPRHRHPMLRKRPG